MFCSNCGKEIPDGSVFCLECGTRLVSDSKEQNSLVINNSEKKKQLKWLFIALGILVIVISVVGLLIYSSQPTVKYEKAEKAVENGDYEKAIKIYTELGDYLDSVDKISSTTLLKHYADGCDLYEKGMFEFAIEELTQAEQTDETKEMIKKSYYGQGIKLYEEGKYIDSSFALKNSGWYEDSDNRILEMGKMMIEESDFESAALIFDNGNELKEDKYVNYAYGMVNFLNKKYLNASTNFVKADNLFDSEEKYIESLYEYALEQFNNKKYTDAKHTFEKIEDYSNSSSMINACELLKCKELMNEGELLTAYNNLCKMPETYSYENVSVSELLNMLENNMAWVNLCGRWTSTTGIAAADCTSRILGRSMGRWTHDIEKDDYSLSIKCILHDDGTVSIKGVGTIFEFTDWSTIQIGLKYNVNKKINFTGRYNSSDCLESYEIDENTALYVSGEKIKLKYLINDNNADTSFTYKYSTDITYKK